MCYIIKPAYQHFEVIEEKIFPEYHYRKELVHTGENDKIELDVCYSTYSGVYIGNLETTNFLIDKGITQIQPKNNNENICSIGFKPEEQKWYGWSHRSFFGFGIGSEVVKGDCAYNPKNQRDFADSLVLFWDDEYHENIRFNYSLRTNEETNEIERGVEIAFEYSNNTPNEAFRDTTSRIFHPFPKSFGNGEWTAKTLDDAKQMAIDYAEGVS